MGQKETASRPAWLVPELCEGLGGSTAELFPPVNLAWSFFLEISGPFPLLSNKQTNKKAM